MRVDDGCIVWINGVEVARFHVDGALSPAYNSFASNHEADVVTFESTNIFNADTFLVEGTNIVAVQAFNTSLSSSDFTIDVSMEELPAGTGAAPTPGAINSCFAATALVAPISSTMASGRDVTPAWAARTATLTPTVGQIRANTFSAACPWCPPTVRQPFLEKWKCSPSAARRIPISCSPARVPRRAATWITSCNSRRTC